MRKIGFFQTYGILAAAAVSLTCAGCGSETPEKAVQRIVVITNAVSPFWDAGEAGAREAEKDLKLKDAGYEVTFNKNTRGTEGQITMLKQYAGAADVAGLCISITDPHNVALMQEIQTLRDSGVKVVTIDSDVDRQKFRDVRFAYIGTDNVVAGRELGRCAKGLVPDGGKFATFVGYKSQANAIERNQGFEEGAGEKFTRVENLGDEVQEDIARKNVRDAYDRNPDIAVYVGIWSYNTPAIVDVVEDLGIRDQVKIIGFDADPPSIKAMAQGKVDAMVVQNPYQMCYQGVRLVKALLEDDQQTVDEMFPKLGDAGQGDVYNTGIKVVVPDEGSPLKEEFFEPSTEFLPLAEFKEWLNEYNLTGS